MATTSDRSKLLSYLLRHAPEKANLTLDREGWCDVEQLLMNTDFTFTELEQLVAADKKGRYTLQSGEYPLTNGRIRANQGHSTDEVRLTFKRAAPPVVLYHGTSTSVIPLILKEGLKPMGRHHVHLSADIDVARSVGGRRRGGHQVLRVDARRAYADGIEFLISDNGVWLVDAVPPKYLESTL